MDKEQIKELLPHRDDMLLLDEITREGDTAHGIYHVRGDEFFLRGHFPGNPVVPGVILCEILAQSACILMGEQIKDGKLPVYTGLDGVKFRHPVKPGDTIETFVQIEKSRPPFYFASGRLEVGGTLCVSAKFSFALTEKI